MGNSHTHQQHTYQITNQNIRNTTTTWNINTIIFTWFFFCWRSVLLSFASSSSRWNKSPTDRRRQGFVAQPLTPQPLTGLDRRDAPSEVDDVRADPLQWGRGHHRLLCSLFGSRQWSRGRLCFHRLVAIRLFPIDRHCDSIFIIIVYVYQYFHHPFLSSCICTRVDACSLHCCWWWWWGCFFWHHGHRFSAS